MFGIDGVGQRGDMLRQPARQGCGQTIDWKSGGRPSQPAGEISAEGAVGRAQIAEVDAMTIDSVERLEHVSGFRSRGVGDAGVGRTLPR